MENFNKGLDSSPSFKGGNKSNNENELNPEMAPKLKSPRNKQLLTKNFMNSTISAAIKASVPRKKILGERIETLDTVEQTSLQRSSKFGSKSVKAPVLNSDDDTEAQILEVQPYDPVKNYLSPRPKFLRYNPDRRRKILNLQENDEDLVKISTYFSIPSSDLQLGLGSSVPSDSCSHQESVEEAQKVNIEKDEDENGEEDDDEEEMVEFGEDRCCSLKGFLKFLFVVIAVILTTQAICSMNSPSPSQTLESVWGVNHRHNHVYGLNFSEVEYGPPIREPDLLMGRLKEGDARIEEFFVVQNAKTDDYVNQDEVQNDDSNVIQDEILQEQDYVEAETIDDFNQDCLIEEDNSDANESKPQLTIEEEYGAEKEFEDMTTNDVLIKITTFDPIIAVLVGHIILTSFTVIYCSKSKKSSAASVTTPVEKEEFKNLEPSTNPQTLIQQKEDTIVTSASILVPPPLRNDVSKVHIPSVELLGEFVFGEEITSNISSDNHSNSSLIQTTADSFSQTKSSHLEISTEDSHTIKKQRRKNAEVITPSPVRRSSRLKTRSIMSP